MKLEKDPIAVGSIVVDRSPGRRARKDPIAVGSIVVDRSPGRRARVTAVESDGTLSVEFANTIDGKFDDIVAKEQGTRKVKEVEFER